MRPSVRNDPSNRGPKNETLSLIGTLILLFVLAIFIRAVIFEPYKIPSESMLPTLQVGDHVIVTKFDYGLRFPFLKKSLFNYAEPARGDVVVFTRPDDLSTPEDDSSINLIKRVVGLPGDTVEVTNGKVFINSIAYEEPYAVWVDGGANYFPPYKVPPGHVLVLGDNRDHSKDSRYWTSPYLPINLIKGKAQIIFFNMNNLKRVGTLLR
jgi:signal peptidase I